MTYPAISIVEGREWYNVLIGMVVATLLVLFAYFSFEMMAPSGTAGHVARTIWVVACLAFAAKGLDLAVEQTRIKCDATSHVLAFKKVRLFWREFKSTSIAKYSTVSVVRSPGRVYSSSTYVIRLDGPNGEVFKLPPIYSRPDAVLIAEVVSRDLGVALDLKGIDRH